MKTFMSLLMMSLLMFAVSCGKDKKSSGADPYAGWYNSGLGAVLPERDAVRAWYEGTAEGTAINSPIVNIRKTEYTYNSGPTCVQKSFLGIPYQYCTFSSSATSQNILSSTPNVVLTFNAGAINTKGNAELDAMFNGSAGNLINATSVGYNMSQLEFLRSDGVVVTYIINRNYHSALNPVIKSETSQSLRREVRTSTY